MNQPNPTYEPVPKPDRTSFWSTVLKIIVALAPPWPAPLACKVASGPSEQDRFRLFHLSP